MKNEELIKISDLYLMNTYKRTPVVLVKGFGARVWDIEGNEYLDFVAGIAVCSLGHCHPTVVEAIKEQASELCHVSNLYHNELQIRLAEIIVTHSFADRVFFCNSGAEANEGAIKLARKYGNEILGGKYEIITMKGSFHGRTLATLAATGQDKFHRGFEPLPTGFRYVIFNDVNALRNAITDKTCAVMLEPVQAEGGVQVPDEGYLREVRELCDEKGVLMILDEVQTGMGRTGKLFAYEHSGVTPDILTLAKALGNGFPVGAVLATEKVASAFEPGSHASTFGGNPLAMAAAKATLETLIRENLVENARKMGIYLKDCLTSLQKKNGIVKEVRGLGLLIGVEIDGDAFSVVEKCFRKGLLVAAAGPSVVRLVPPLIISESDCNRAVSVLQQALE
ncbi:MAG: acetylornithine transaminase [Syntrophales bacterium]|nr:acetylornithine transaminase [Syntrophales bacterium]